MRGLEGRQLNEGCIDANNGREVLQVDTKPTSIVNLRHKAAISECDVVADTVATSALNERRLESLEAFRNPVLGPLVARRLIRANLLEHSHVLQGLRVSDDNLRDLAREVAVVRVLRQESVCRVNLFQVLKDGHALIEVVAIDVKRGDLVHGIELSILCVVLAAGYKVDSLVAVQVKRGNDNVVASRTCTESP